MASLEPTTPDAGEKPPHDGGQGLGGFFVLNPGANVAWRWDPLKLRCGDWVDWPLPAKTPETKETLTDALRGALTRIGKEEESEGESEDEKGATASASVADSYSKGIDKYRDNIKWFVVSAGAAAVALVGTAPLAGAGAALSSGGLTRAAWGLLIAIFSIALILIVAAWTLQPLEISLPRLAKAPAFGMFPYWRRRMHDEYRDDWANLLDGRAPDLKSFETYRTAWLGVVSDVDRQSLDEDVEWRSKKLGKYKELAEARLKEDTPNVSLILKRGIARRTRRRGQIALTISGVLSLGAVVGYIVFLGGAGQAPIITAINVSPEPAIGADVSLTVEATGSGFSYTWWREGSPDPIPEQDGPVYVIRDFDGSDVGVYRVRVLSGDRKLADMDEVQLSIPEEPPTPATQPGQSGIDE